MDRLTELNIRWNVGEAALYEQLAEEATELAHAAMKLARILRNENPTPMSEAEARSNVREEYSDVTLCSLILKLTADEEIIKTKNKRWVDRILEFKSGKKPGWEFLGK